MKENKADRHKSRTRLCKPLRKKVMCDQPTDQWTDQLTDGPTNQQSDLQSRVHRTKKKDGSHYGQK